MKARGPAPIRAAIGLRAHSGWAALVAVAGTPRSPTVLLRRRIELSDPTFPGSKQPYHAAEGQKLEKAREIVSRCASDARRLAEGAFREVLTELDGKRHRAAGCSLLIASGRPLPELESILASHALIHTADGELFREALEHASRMWGIPVTRVREKEVFERAASDLAISGDELRLRIKQIGRSIGPPWTADQKLAVLAAWMAPGAR